MTATFRNLGLGLATAIVSVSFASAGPWDGSWYLDNSKSRYAQHSVTLTRLAHGMWQYGDGAVATIFTLDGKPYPEPNAPDFTMTARLTGTNILDLVESGYGRDMERDRWTLAPDGKSLAVAATRLYPDGHEVSSTSRMIRIAGSSGFEGRWKDAPPEHVPAGDASAGDAPAPTDNASRPYWVISTAPDATMSWFIPATGELIRGKADGIARPLTGPQQPRNRTFAWKQASPSQLEFYARDSGQLIERATESLSADGKTFTDILWLVGHEDEKDVRVFERR